MDALIALVAQQPVAVVPPPLPAPKCSLLAPSGGPCMCVQTSTSLFLHDSMRTAGMCVKCSHPPWEHAAN
jgi:hypothetical protein